MDGNAGACADCTRSCLSLHRARLDPSPAAHSFFKVMFGTEFSKELIVPPRFVRTLNSLEGRDTYLEDSTGQKWDIRLAKVKGSLVIQRGWREFALDHGIELGDVLVFHYITRSHFIVQIFTRSGCEKPVLFSEINYQNKRIKAARDSDARKGSDGISDAEILPKENSRSPVASGLDVDSAKSLDNVRRSVRLAEDRPVEGNPRKRPKVPPAKDPLVEPYFMTSRSTNFSREDDRDYLFDLSAFEMPTTKVCTEEKSIVEVNRYQGVSQSQNAQMGTSSVDIIKWQIGEMNPLLAPNEACLAAEEPNLLLKSSLDVDMPLNSNMPQRVPTSIAMKCQAEAAIGTGTRLVKKEQQPCQKNSGYMGAHNSCNVPRDNLKLSRLKEPRSNNRDLGNLNDKVAPVKKVVKPEPVDFYDSTSVLKIKITCSEQQDSEPFLELPKCLPIKVHRHGSKVDQKMIVLRDPSGKRWPVIYQERNNIKVLANGWKEFMKYNNIQPGDQCTLALENIDDCIFKVEILRS